MWYFGFFEELNHPSYGSDLASSDYFIFQNQKRLLRGHLFSSHSELKGAVSQWFEKQDKETILKE
jgi:hypothetical protein